MHDIQSLEPKQHRQTDLKDKGEIQSSLLTTLHEKKIPSKKKVLSYFLMF